MPMLLLLYPAAPYVATDARQITGLLASVSTTVTLKASR